MERLSGKDLTLDGDLLSYKDGRVYASATQSAVISLGGKLGMGQGEIMRDLKLEKRRLWPKRALPQNLRAGGPALRRPRRANNCRRSI